MKRWLVVAPLALIASTGCLASKGDIRLLQDELRLSRSRVDTVDAAVNRTSDQRRQQIAALSAQIDRMNDSLRVLAARFASFQGTVNGELDAMGRQMVSMQSLLGQTTRNVQDAKAQLEALKEQGGSGGGAAPPVASDPNRAAGTPGIPGASTLFVTAMDQLGNGANATARSGFDQLLTSYPNSPEASRAQLYIGISYANDRNTAAADSVYQVVFTKYPKTPEAAQALYKHGLILWDADKKNEAMIQFNRILRDYPDSDEATLVKAKLKER